MVTMIKEGMKQVKTDRWIYKTWAEHLDEMAAQQVDQVKDSPLIDKPLALMSDVHGGYTVPIGCVLISNEYVMPEIIGPDVGCGIDNVVLKTDKRLNLDRLYKFIDKQKGSFYTDSTAYDSLLESTYDKIKHNKEGEVRADLKEKIVSQFGTLGGGNHFIEVQEVEGEKYTYSIMVHSGSRGAGGAIFNYYIAKFKEFSKKYRLQEEFTPYLPKSDELASQYIQDVKTLCTYAQANREVIFTSLVDYIKSRYKCTVYEDLSARCTHNFIEVVDEAFVYRKGANATCTQEELNGRTLYMPKMVIVAGSQGTPSYLCRGLLTSEEAYYSCSHGAGRQLSRRQARERLNLQDQMRIMKRAGVQNHRLTSSSFLDEAPGAYKNIKQVMEAQKDLVEIVHELNPVLNWKMKD